MPSVSRQLFRIIIISIKVSHFFFIQPIRWLWFEFKVNWCVHIFFAKSANLNDWYWLAFLMVGIICALCWPSMCLHKCVWVYSMQLRILHPSIYIHQLIFHFMSNHIITECHSKREIQCIGICYLSISLIVYIKISCPCSLSRCLSLSGLVTQIKNECMHW